MSVEHEPGLVWNPITTFTSQFGNYDTTTFGPCAYAKDDDGWVHLRGLVFCNAASPAAVVNPIFSLPVGFWALKQEIFLCIGAWGASRIDVLQNGQVHFTTPSHIGTYSASTYGPSLAGIKWFAA